MDTCASLQYRIARSRRAMVDVLTVAQRQFNMIRIRGRDTKPELVLRRGLHAAGLRFRLHARDLPGCPDLVFPRYRAAILVHGCFWHGHHCPLFKLPATRTEFWSTKIAGNQQRDQRTAEGLRRAGWRILTVWECSLKGPARRAEDTVLHDCALFIRSRRNCAEICGGW